MIRRPPRSTLDRSSAASDVYKRQEPNWARVAASTVAAVKNSRRIMCCGTSRDRWVAAPLSLIHISEPTRPY